MADWSSDGEPLRVSRRALEGDAGAVDVEDDYDALADRCTGIGLCRVPVLGDGAVDDVHVVREACTEGAVLHHGGGGAVLELKGGLRDADSGRLAGSGLVGLRRSWLRMLRRRGGGLLGYLGRLDLLGKRDLVGIGRRLGLLGGEKRRGAGVLGGEDAGVELALLGRKRKRGDHRGLDGSGVGGLFAPVVTTIVEVSESGDSRSDGEVKRERTYEVLSQILICELLVGIPAKICHAGRELFVLDGAGNDADVGDAGLLHGVHDGGEGSEGNALVGAKVDDALGGIAFCRWCEGV